MAAELAPCNRSYEDTLLQSAEDGEERDVLSALKANADIKCINESNETALHLAAKKGHLEIVDILIAKGANITYNFTDKNKWTPLDVAVKEGHEEIAKLLVEKGCPVTNTAMKFATQAGLISTIKFVIENCNVDLAECSPEDGRTLLHHAAEYGHIDIVELLLNGKRSVEINCKDFLHRKRPIHLAVQKCYIDIVQMLVDHNADVNCKDVDGMTPLHYGLKTKNITIVEHLLQYCHSNPNICDKDNRSVLHFAVDMIVYYFQNPLNKDDSEDDEDKLISIIEIIAKQADVNIKDKDGNTPLLCAVLNCCEKLVTILLKNKANPNIRNKEEHTALQYAVSQKNFTILTLLLDYNADINATMTKKEEQFQDDIMSKVKVDETALHFVIRQRFESRFYELLLNRGANLKICDADGYTALHYAALERDIDLILYLISKGADFTAKDVDGLTLLHHAAIMNSYRLTKKVLANKKLDVNVTCKKGKTALLYASESNECANDKENIISLLIERGAHINCRNEEDGMTPLLYAVSQECALIAETIIKAAKQQGIEKITIQAINKSKMTALHIAISNKDDDILNLLLQSDYVLNEADENGMSPLHFGSLHGFLPYYLLEHKQFRNCLNHQNEITGKTSLHYAVEYNHQDVMKELLEKGANIFLEDKDSHSSLYYAIKNNSQHEIISQHASEHCDEINGHQMSGWLPLHYAIQYDSFSTFCLMVENHFVLDSEMKGSWTPLHIASCRGVVEVVDFILGKISSIEYVNKLQESNSTAMHLAAKNGHYDVVKLLYEHGADAVMNYKDAYGMTPFNYIAESQSWDFLDSLNAGKESSLSNLSDVPQYSKYESAAILFAVHKNEEQTVKRLISTGANVDSKDKYTGKTPLHIAAEDNNLEMANLLLSFKVNPNSEDKSGAHPLNMSFKAYDRQVYNLIKSAGGVFNFDRLLLDSSAVNDVTQMKTCLENGANIDYYDKDERTALHYAVLNNHYDSVVFLIEYGCNINCQDKGFYTAVHFAVINGYHEILKTLISLNADLNVKTELNEKTALHYAVENSNNKSFELLINSQSINVNEKDSKSMTPLHFAAQLGFTDMVQKLLKKNAIASCKNTMEVTPLHFVCDSKDSHTDIVRLLLEAGADPKMKDMMLHHTPLHKAAIRGHFEIISILLTMTLKIDDKCQIVMKLPWKKGAKKIHGTYPLRISCEYHETKTALHLAAENGHAKAVEVLLNHNASIDIADSENFKTALHLAAENGHKSVVKVLVQRGANLRKKDSDNKIPFHYALKHQDKDRELINLLTIDNCKLKNKKILDEEIHDVGVCGRLDIIKSHEAEIEICDKWGKTVFHYAAENGHLHAVEYLLTVSDPEKEDISGYTPFYFAVSNGHSKIVLCLLNSSRVNKDKLYGYHKQTSLYIAAENGFIDIVKYLLHSKANCNIGDMRKRTPLHIAAEKGYEEIVTLLLENGASIHIKDFASYTPLHYGVESGNIKTVELLLQRGIPQFKHQSTHLSIPAGKSYTEIDKFLMENMGSIEITQITEPSIDSDFLPHGCVETSLAIAFRRKIERGESLLLKDSWYTAISNAACKGNAEVIELLIEKANFDVMPAFPGDHFITPLHHAVLYGQSKVINIFLSYIDITLKGRSPMHDAAEHGLIDIAQLLEKHGSSVDDEDKDGLRPLHYACRANQVEMVDYLLRTGGVRDPLKVSKEGLSPLDVIAVESTARTKLLQLFRPYVDSHTEYPIETYAKVFICGYSTAGKSSLSQALVDRSKKPLGYKFSPLEVVKDVTPFTVGIDLHTISSPEIGNIVLHDFAGHTEFYSSHAGILENLMLHSPGVFVIIADLRKPHSKVQSELFYWLNFIENACAKLPKPSQVILVGSRADSFSNHGLEFKTGMNDIVDNARLRQVFRGYCGLECHKPGGIGMKDFVSILATSCKEVVDRSDGISYYCHLLYSLLKDLDEVAITFKNLLIKIKENREVTISDDPAFVSNTLLTLSDKGLILYLKSNDPSTSWIVVDRVKLLSKVGVLFAPASIERVHRDIASNIGIITFSQLKSLCESNLDPHMLKGFLTTLEFCQVIDSDVLDSSYDYSAEELLFFPALIAEKQPAEMKKAPARGWYLKCTNPHKFFTVRFLHVLILRLALFNVSNGKKSEVLDRHCTIWIDGIHWISHNIEVLVQVSLDDRCITVLISEKDNLTAQKIFSSIISEIHSLMDKLSPCATKEYIINPSQLKEVSKLKEKDLSLFLFENIAQAMILRQQVSDEGEQYDRPVDIILDSYEPYLSIPPFVLQELFNAELSNNKIHQSRIDYLFLVCPDIMKDAAFTSYKEVRDHIQLFSIFRSYNVVNLALSCDSATSKEKKQLSDLLTKPLSFDFKERKPLKQEMLKLLSGEISSQWFIFGTFLGLPSDFLTSLKQSNAFDNQKFAQVVEMWLSKSNNHCTWNKVIEALENLSGLAKHSVNKFLGENVAKSSNFTETGDKSQDVPDKATSLETLSSISSVNTEKATNAPVVPLTSTPMPSTSEAESVCTEEQNMPLPSDMPVINTGTSESNTSTPHSSPQKGMTTSVNTESATNVPLIALTSTPMLSTSEAESVCTEEQNMPLPNDMPVINTGTSESNTSTPHSSPQKGMTTSVDIDSSCKDDTSDKGAVSYSQAPSIANNTSVAYDSSLLQQQHIYTMITVSIHVITFLNGLFANPWQYSSSMSSNTGRVSNGVLMKCSSHLGQLPKLAGYLGIPDRCLQQIQNDFTDPDIQGYHLLKKWKELNPNSSLADLIEVFQHLGLNEAVKVLKEN